MQVPQFLARQLACPSGLFGRYVMGRYLNRVTTAHNALVCDEMAVRDTDRVLEVGFGGGALLERIVQQASNGLVAGLDLSEEMVANARSRLRGLISSGRLQLFQGSIKSLPFLNAHFDKACSVNTVYFWPDLASAFEEFSRVIRPGGRLVLGFMSDEDVRRTGLGGRGFSLYSTDAIKAALSEQGFRPGTLRSGSDMRGTYFALAAERAL